MSMHFVLLIYIIGKGEKVPDFSRTIFLVATTQRGSMGETQQAQAWVSADLGCRLNPT